MKVKAPTGYRKLSLCSGDLTSPSASGLTLETLQSSILIRHTSRNKKFPGFNKKTREIYSSLYWQLLCRTLYGFPDSINGSVFCMPRATGL